MLENSYISPSTETKDRYVRFSNSDGKAWVVPTKNMRTALNIYQPSGVRGRLVKLLLPYLHWSTAVQNRIKARRLQIKLDSSISELLRRVLVVESFEFSIFEGTPSTHQKVTIQISQGDKILAYCKLSSNKSVESLFRHEQHILTTLHQKGVRNIPEPLYCGAVNQSNNTIAFIQSTTKTNHSVISHAWQSEHDKFLQRLHNSTKVRLPFSQSDFARSISVLEGYLPSLQEVNAELIRQAITSVRSYYGDGEVEFSAHHGDFTPWNTFLEDDKLFVFDWEYSSLSYPPYLDRFHFVTQTAIFARRVSAEELISEFKGEEIANFDISYTSYLLDVMSRYIDRERGTLSDHTKRMLSIWSDLLRKI